jgi:hypothetical protein
MVQVKFAAGHRIMNRVESSGKQKREDLFNNGIKGIPENGSG